MNLIRRTVLAASALLASGLTFAAPAPAKPAPARPVSAPTLAVPETGSNLLARTKALLDKPSTWNRIPAKVTLCLYAPGGTNSRAYEYAMSSLTQLPKYTAMAKEVGIDLNVTFTSPTSLRIDIASAKLKRKASTDVKINLFTDERIATEEFKVGQCDGVAISNLRGRQFNPFVGSLDAIGAILSYQQLTEAINFLAKPEMGSYMVSQDVEIVGIVPLGAAYVMVNDRRINTLAKAAGRKVAVLDFDKSQATMVQKIGAQPVSVDLTSIGGKFNNGQVDILALPALAFEPLELYRGMTDDKGNARGAIFKFPLLQVTGVLMMHRGKFPDGIGQLVREFTAMQLAPAYQFILETESAIPVKYWMDIPETDKPGYVNMLRNARLAVTKEGYYDVRMMQLLKKVRCKLDPANYECSLSDE
ncbi:MAG TPA: putative solute-binding protein [Fluviicoccus sp.]|nr:putative solute-binding protein [Fluviicoccus sp.]